MPPGLQYEGPTDLDPLLPADLRAEAAAWAFFADTPVPSGPDGTSWSFQPDPAWEAAEEAFLADHPDLDGRNDIARLVPAFGPFAVGDATHRRLSWLCVNALRMVLHCWDEICDGPDARDRLAALAAHLRGDDPDPDRPVTLEPAVPTRDGLVIGDCDVCRVGPIAEGVALAARFAEGGDPADAAEALRRAQWSGDEGCWWHDPHDASSAPRPFGGWFVLHALPAAWTCEQLPPAEPGVPAWRVVPGG